MTDAVDGNGLPTQFSEGHDLISFNQSRIYCRLRHVESNPVENLNKMLIGHHSNRSARKYSSWRSFKKNNRKFVGGRF